MSQVLRKSYERMSRSKISLLFKMDKKLCVRKFEWHTRSKILRILQTEIHTGPDRSTPDLFSYPVPNRFTCESDPGWNCTIPVWYGTRANPTLGSTKGAAGECGTRPILPGHVTAQRRRAEQISANGKEDGRYIDVGGDHHKTHHWVILWFGK